MDEADVLFLEQPSAYGLLLASQPRLDDLTTLGRWWAEGIVDKLRQQSGSYPIEDGDG